MIENLRDMDSPLQLKHPPLREAVLEIIFKQELKWDDLIIPTFLFKKIISRFPEKKTVTEGMVQFDLEVGREPMHSISKKEIPQFLNTDGNIFVILKKNQISIHHILPYTSWKNYLDTINFVYENLRKVLEEETKQILSKNDIKRIGLRYINDFDIPGKEYNLEENFKVKPPTLDNKESLHGFLIGNAYRYVKDEMKIQFYTNGGTDQEYKFILDLDFYTQSCQEEVEVWLEKAHKKIEEFFLKILSQKTIDLFNR